LPSEEIVQVPLTVPPAPPSAVAPPAPPAPVAEMATHVLPLGTFRPWTVPVKLKVVVVEDEPHAEEVFPPLLALPVLVLPPPPQATKHPTNEKNKMRTMAIFLVFNFPPNFWISNLSTPKRHWHIFAFGPSIEMSETLEIKVYWSDGSRLIVSTSMSRTAL
jgi:hypothetical protein